MRQASKRVPWTALSIRPLPPKKSPRESTPRRVDRRFVAGPGTTITDRGPSNEAREPRTEDLQPGPES
jgi:hypothetical protein